jgi:catechol 2,3-dioxygenase-like lactoylglutathione lyase family enzyme
MIARIDHTAISVPDLDRALAFYCDLLGFRLEFRWDWQRDDAIDTLVGLRDSAARSAMLELGGSRIELFEYHNPPVAPRSSPRPVCDHGITHLCFNVDDIAAEYARLSAAGVEFHSAPLAFGRLIYVYGRDPFGNVFELKEVRARTAPPAPQPG